MNTPEHKVNIETEKDSLSTAQHLKLVEQELASVKQWIDSQLTSPLDEVNARLKHVANATGKMLRPTLVLLCGKCIAPTTDVHVKSAGLIEMVHMATLLHDDVIDHADSRRNYPTPNALWGNEAAVLLGDFVLSRVFSQSARLGNQAITQILADTAVQICHGELHQNTQRQNWDLPEEQYITIIRDKTALLFESACKIGAIAANANKKQEEALAAFGLNIGIAFQIADDLLDITGSEDVEGKTLGTDIESSKLTLPVIHLLSTVDPKDKPKVLQWLTQPSKSPQLAEMLQAPDVVEYTKQKANDYCDKAIQSVSTLDASPARDAMIQVVKYIAGRCL